MIIPWQVDVPQDRLPFANWLIIAGIIVVFALQVKIINDQPAQRRTKRIQAIDNRTIGEHDADQQKLKEQRPLGYLTDFILDSFDIRGLFGYIWLHAGLFHLLGNLLFLWIFGNAICAKIGNVIYLPVYLILGIAAGIVHITFRGGPVIGASGAINGIIGMYLVFFPKNDITCYFVWIFPIVLREFTISSFWIILLWLAFDIFGASISANQVGGVAYFAHLGGFTVGFAIAILMLKKKWIKMERYEKSLLQMWKGRKESAPQLYGVNHWMNPNDLRELETAPEPPKQNIIKKAPTIEKISTTELTEPKQGILRFTCSCGKIVKVPAKYAGKVGSCPRCKGRIRVPKK